MQTRNIGKFARAASRVLGEDGRDSARIEPEDLARQVIADAMRATNAAGTNQRFSVRLGKAVGEVDLGVTGGAYGEEEYLELRVEVGSEKTEFFLDGESVASCGSNGNEYDRALAELTIAIQKARMGQSDGANRLSATPSYGRLAKVGEPY